MPTVNPSRLEGSGFDIGTRSVLYKSGSEVVPDIEVEKVQPEITHREYRDDYSYHNALSYFIF